VNRAFKNFSTENISPEQKPLVEIFAGINRHFEVDKIFHGSEFFKTHTEFLKNEILKNDALSALHYRTWFLAHLFLELLIDRVLLKTLVNKEPQQFYDFLKNINEADIERFFVCCGKENLLSGFLQTRTRHLQSQFLFSYGDNEMFCRALLWLYKKANPSIFENNIPLQLTNLLLNAEEKLQQEICIFVNNLNTQLKTSTLRA